MIDYFCIGGHTGTTRSDFLSDVVLKVVIHQDRSTKSINNGKWNQAQHQYSTKCSTQLELYRWFSHSF